MTMITPSYLGETIEYSSLHACRSTLEDPTTIASALAGPHTLRVGLAWWIFGTMLALLYFSIVYWLFRGKVAQHADGYGH